MLRRKANIIIVLPVILVLRNVSPINIYFFNNTFDVIL